MNGLGHVTSFSLYDANGRPGRKTDPNGIITLFTYDTLGSARQHECEASYNCRQRCYHHVRI
jgi:uncharacterized protein RhaS with RHS repeats